MKRPLFIFIVIFLAIMAANIIYSGRQQANYCIQCGEETVGSLTIYQDNFGSARWYQFGYPTFLSRGVHPPLTPNQQEYLLGDPKNYPWEISYPNFFWNVLWMLGISLLATQAIVLIINLISKRTIRMRTQG